MTAVLQLTDDEYAQHLATVDAAQILDHVLGLHPLDGWDDEENYDHEETR